MTDRTHPEAGSTHIIRFALELGLLWIDGSGRDKVREALDALDALEAQLEAIGAGGVGPLIACAGFSAADMATAAAQGFRDGVASLSANAGEPTQGAFQRALSIRTAQGWKLGGDKVPVLYADEINGEQVCRDDVWLCTTAALASPPTAQAEGWISVDERLPGEQGHDSEQVLVFINGHCELTSMECRQGGAWGLRLGYFDADRQVFRVHGRPEPHVTHWRQEPPAPPLPDAPRPRPC